MRYTVTFQVDGPEDAPEMIDAVSEFLAHEPVYVQTGGFDEIDYEKQEFDELRLVQDSVHIERHERGVDGVKDRLLAFIRDDLCDLAEALPGGADHLVEKKRLRLIREIEGGNST